MDAIGNVLVDVMRKALRTSSRPGLNERECSFCGSELEPLTVFEIGGKKVPFGAQRCDCEEAQKLWDEYDRKREEDRKQEEARERKDRVARLFQVSMLPARWKTRTFENYELTPENREAYNLAREYAESFDPQDGRGVLFTGNVGIGKTHLAVALSMETMSREHSVVFGTVTNLLDEYRNSYDDNRVHSSDVTKKLTRCDLLVIDDLGKEKVTEWVEQMVYEIINARYEQNRCLVITTNLTLAEIRKKYGERGDAIVSRILEMCHGVPMKGRDWRRKGLSSSG